jgi:phenylacetate-CoA ligase
MKPREAMFRFSVWVMRKTDPNVTQALDLLEWGETASLAEMTEYRLRELRSLLQHCQAQVPYYRELMRERGINPDKIQSLDDLRKFPVLTKDTIRRDGEAMIARELRPGDYEVRKTGGTTGEPIASYVDHRTRVMETYTAFRGDQWMGWRPWMRKIKLWGGSLGRPASRGLRSKMRSFVLGHVPLAAFSVNAKTAPDYARTIMQAGPSIMIGYSSALYLLAQEVAKLGEFQWPLHAIFPTAAEMPAEWARYVSMVFKCPVRRYFGCAEVNSLGFQTTDEGPYLIPDEHVVLETVRPGTPEAEVVPPGSLLITSLFNRARPLIRYANGDQADIAPPGELHPTRSCIRELGGRGADMFVLRDGTRLSANFGAKIISALKPPVKRFQFIQRDYEQVEFRYEPLDRDLTREELKEITDILRSHMSPVLEIAVSKTADFVVSSGNKHRTMICQVAGASRPETAVPA